MKKKSYAMLSLIILLALTFLAGCESNSTVKSLGKEKSYPRAKDEKTAVVYFSATGNTSKIAEFIAEESGADLFEIIPEVMYTSQDLNYSDDDCRANQEMQEDARPAIAKDLRATMDYDKIYLGYPIWWGTTPRIILTYLEKYDISKTTVYVFCTSGGSGIEQSMQEIKDLYPDINIVQGKRFSVSSSVEDVKEWIKDLN